MKTFGKVWNESNQYGIPKSIFKCLQCLLLLLNGLFEILQKNNSMTYLWEFCKNTLLHNNIR
jgi:hypothetical protein